MVRKNSRSAQKTTSGEHRRSSKKHHYMRDSVVTFIVFALVGIIIVANQQINGEQSSPTNVEGVIARRSERVSELHKEIKSLTEQINVLKEVVGNNSGSASDDSASSNSSATTVLPALTGPGVTVTLDDSPQWKQVSESDSNSINVNDYVVHQQDIEAVVNALWAGGAEAMTIEGQRVLPTTAVRCVGNVLSLEGKQYAPPYKISAIGSQTKLINALNDSEAITVYKQYVEADGLGWDVQKVSTLKFAKATSTMQSLKYAQAASSNNK